MTARPPVPLWAVASVFAVSVASVPLVSPLTRPSAAPPSTVRELTELLQRTGPPLYAVPAGQHTPEDGVYLFVQPPSRERVERLFRVPEFIDRWQGVVLCEPANKLGTIPEEMLQSWGECSVQIGALLFFGDPALLRRIHEVILGS